MNLAGHPVRITVVHPGYVKTAIARNAGSAEGVIVVAAGSRSNDQNLWMALGLVT